MRNNNFLRRFVDFSEDFEIKESKQNYDDDKETQNKSKGSIIIIILSLSYSEINRIT